MCWRLSVFRVCSAMSHRILSIFKRMDFMEQMGWVIARATAVCDATSIPLSYSGVDRRTFGYIWYSIDFSRLYLLMLSMDLR